MESTAQYWKPVWEALERQWRRCQVTSRPGTETQKNTKNVQSKRMILLFRHLSCEMAVELD
jgi:hypothetical protein